MRTSSNPFSLIKSWRLESGWNLRSALTSKTIFLSTEEILAFRKFVDGSPIKSATKRFIGL